MIALVSPLSRRFSVWDVGLWEHLDVMTDDGIFPDVPLWDIAGWHNVGGKSSAGSFTRSLHV